MLSVRMVMVRREPASAVPGSDMHDSLVTLLLMNGFPTHTKTYARTNNGKTVVVRYTSGQRGKLDHQHLPVLRRHTATVVHALQRHAVLAHRLLLHRVIGPEAAAIAVRHSHAQ